MPWETKALLLVLFASTVDLSACTGNTKDNTKNLQVRCNKKSVQDRFKKCLTGAADAQARTACKKSFKEAIKACGGKKPDAVETARLTEEAAQSAMAKCRIAKKEDCDKQYAATTGKTLPTDPTQLKNKNRLEAARGRSSALADKMKGCTTLQCKEDARKEMATLAGRNISKQEFAYDTRQAGSRAGGDFVKECVANATGAAEKRKCFNSDKAKEAFAKASGKKKGDINDIDMKKAARDRASSSVREIMEACVAAAADDNAKKACRKRDDLREEIANSQGENATNVRDSNVRSFIKRGAEGDMLTASRECDKANLAECKKQMKEVYAKSTGKNASNISDDTIKRNHKSAMARNIGDRMSACMEDAGTNKTTQAACRDMVKQEMKMADYEKSRRTPSKADIEKTLRDAGRAKAGEVMESCNKSWTRTQCLTEMKSRVAKSMGKSSSDVKQSEAEKLNRAAGFTAAREAAAACAEAKKDNASATCDDITKKFNDVRKISTPGNKKAQERQKNSVRQGAAIDMEKSLQKVCIEKASKADYDKCMKDFKGSKDSTMKQLYSGLSDSDRAKRVQTAGRQAKVEVLGDEYIACMKAAAGVKEDQKKCKTLLSSMKDKTGVTDKADDVLKIYRGQELAKASLACVDAGSKAQCRKDAKAEAVSTGMRAREWGTVKRTGEMEAAAKAWAACKLNATKTDAECLDDAKLAWETVSGSTDAAAWDAVKAKISKLGKAKIDGKPLKIKSKKQIDVDVQTSATACSPELKTAFTDKLTALLTQVNKTKTGNKTLSKVKGRGAGCRVVDGKAELAAGVGAGNLTDAEIDQASDDLATLTQGMQINTARRLLADQFLANSDKAEPRRLTTYTVESAYVAQGTELCASDDSACGATDNFDGTGGNTGIAQSDAWRCTVNAAVAIAMLLAASSL